MQQQHTVSARVRWRRATLGGALSPSGGAVPTWFAASTARKALRCGSAARIHATRAALPCKNAVHPRPAAGWPARTSPAPAQHPASPGHIYPGATPVRGSGLLSLGLCETGKPKRKAKTRERVGEQGHIPRPRPRDAVGVGHGGRGEPLRFVPAHMKAAALGCDGEQCGDAVCLLALRACCLLPTQRSCCLPRCRQHPEQAVKAQL